MIRWGSSRHLPNGVGGEPLDVEFRISNFEFQTALPSAFIAGVGGEQIRSSKFEIRNIRKSGRIVTGKPSSVCILGAGPIRIGQACEFDYSGVQGVRALREEGCRVILVNSNPATVMTDARLAHRSYVEPLTVRPPRASPSSWQPMQMPRIGSRPTSSPIIVAAPTTAAGSPGPLESSTPA